jgi:pyruvate dehydrogenase E2 component (dihydrolipoamide acetyltransferase)
MSAIEVILPKVDMDMDSGVIVAWKVSEGERVQQGDILFEMETGKAMMEVEAPGTGIIRSLAKISGEPIAVGTAVAWIHPDGEA